jgi:hypothetical protein
MNPSVNDPGEQATDKLLFQYLEGELTNEQTKTLEAWLVADPALRSELELWQAAFVTPDAHDTAALEARLLQEPVPPAGIPVSRWLPGLVLVAVLFLSVPLLTERELVRKKPLHVPPAARQAKELPRPAPVMGASVGIPGRASQPAPAALGQGVADHTVPVSKTSRPAAEDQTEVVSPSPAPVPMAAVDPLAPVATLQAVPVPEGTELVTVPEQPVKKVKVAVVKTFTRQQRGAIARMKRRAIQQRKANEFLKGNIPYVVPLNPNSF